MLRWNRGSAAEAEVIRTIRQVTLSASENALTDEDSEIRGIRVDTNVSKSVATSSFNLQFHSVSSDQFKVF